MHEQIPEDVKSARLAQLQTLVERQHAAFRDRCVGRTFDVLFEKPGRHPGQIAGRLPYLEPVQVSADAALIGTVAPVTVTAAGPNSLFGEVGMRPRDEPRIAVPVEA